MADCNITFEIVYEKSDCDLSECSGCGDIIYTQNNEVIMKVNDSKKPMFIRFCDSCFDAVIKNS